MPSKTHSPSPQASKPTDPTDPPSPSDPDTSINPYIILSVPTTATDAEIRTAYKKLALQHHPDKHPPHLRPTAHTTFQRLALAYGILSSPARRSLYDATGSTASTLADADDDFSWPDFFRAQYAAVTPDGIGDFKRSYQGSAEESADVLKAYVAAQGRMEGVYERVMLANCLEDEERLRGVIDAAVGRGEVQAYKAYGEETAKGRERRFKRARREKAEAERHEVDLGLGGKGAEGKGRGGGMGDLAALIQQRGRGRQEAFLEGLERRYAGGEKGGGGKKGRVEEPDEEAFERVAKRGRQKKVEEEVEVEEEVKSQRKPRPRKRKVEEVEAEDENEEEVQPSPKIKKRAGKRKPAKS
ncbi:hypothetical protein MMC17_005447 [Xylographa soralifera]|nr:hypothetical protein [Xylographa soralifera]